MNSSGKVLTIFLVIIAILLISLTAISLFFFQKETERRKLTETTLEEVRAQKVKLEEDLKEVKKQNFLLQEKNKEADERVNDLSDELELEKGLREEMKLETVALQEQLDEANSAKEELAEAIQEKEELQEQLIADIMASDLKIKELEAQLQAEVERAEKLNELIEKKQEEMSEMEKEAAVEIPDLEQPSFDMASGGTANAPDEDTEEPVGFEVELGEIVVVPGERIDDEEVPNVPEPAYEEMPVIALERDSQGRILSVDVETEFVIVSVGELDGIEIGDVLCVYRNDDYVGDLRITRLQPEMAAADLIPPFTIMNVKKNDQVKAKQ